MNKKPLTIAMVASVASAGTVATVQWSKLSRKEQASVEVNAGLDFRVVSCRFPVTVQLKGEWFYKDRPNWNQK